jgi:hypothetical protein
MSVLDTLKRSLIMFFIGLPLIIINVILFLGLGLGNAGLLFLSAGQIFLVPVAVMVCHLLTSLLPHNYFEVSYDGISQLVPSDPIAFASSQINVSPSYWMAHFTFFCSYLVSNAYAIYKLKPVSDDPSYTVKVQNRMTRATIIMSFIVVLFVTLSIIRYRYTNTERVAGLVIATGVFGALGYAWFIASNSLGIRTMDIFGVAQQMLITRNPSTPTACVTSTA